MTDKTQVSLDLKIEESQYPAIFVSGGLDSFYQEIRRQVTSEVNDPSTKKGAERIKSLAAKVSSSKKAVENPGREYLKQLKEMPKVIEAELREWVQKMDALRDEVRKPVTDLEEKGKARVALLEKRLEDLKSIAKQLDCMDVYNQNSSVISRWIETLNEIDVDDSWEELKETAQLAKDVGLSELNKAFEFAKEREAQQAEIERLKAEQAKRDQEERERQIAERARYEAEQKALREKLEIEQREQAAKDAQAKAEKDAKDAQERLIREQQESAERERIAVEQAAERERQRIANEEAAAKAEAKRREDDINHKRLINNEAMQSLMSELSFLTEEQAKEVVKAIAMRKIKNISISY